jgi:Xaa-Pro aminopeptidase
LSRTVSVGPADPNAARVYAAVREAQQAAIDAVRPGVTASEVDAAARAVLGSHGLDDTFGHGTGHGLGLEVHEEPRLGRPRKEGPPPERLAPGMVFTIEPGAYIAGWGGVRIEDDVLVTDEAHELLTAVTRELIAVGS